MIYFNGFLNGFENKVTKRFYRETVSLLDFLTHQKPC